MHRMLLRPTFGKNGISCKIIDVNSHAYATRGKKYFQYWHIKNGWNYHVEVKKKIQIDRKVIKSFKDSLSEKAGFLIMKGNFFSSAVMKTSVISSEFRERYLSNPNHLNVFKGKAVVFEGPEDYHKRINSKNLKIDEN